MAVLFAICLLAEGAVVQTAQFLGTAIVLRTFYVPRMDRTFLSPELNVERWNPLNAST